MEGLFLQSINAGYNDSLILKNLELRVEPGETMVVMGTSGAGKTTLLKTILGIIQPKSGNIVLNGRTITHTPIEQRNIGYLSQFYSLFPHLNVQENVGYGLQIRRYAFDERNKRVDQLLTMLELKNLAQARIQDLSGGQQQRVALARALAPNPDLIVLDEPLSNIDQVTKLEVASYLKKSFISLNIPVVLVTHQWEDAKFLGNKIAILVGGKIEQTGSFEAIIQNPKSPFIKKLLMPYSE